MLRGAAERESPSASHTRPNGGLKWPRVKPWEKRKLRGFESGGATVMKLSNLVALGIKMLDITKTHVAT